jgi:hypothetical protein
MTPQMIMAAAFADELEKIANQPAYNSPAWHAQAQANEGGAIARLRAAAPKPAAPKPAGPVAREVVRSAAGYQRQANTAAAARGQRSFSPYATLPTR